MRWLALALVCSLAASCGFSHVNRDLSTRPERSTGGAASVYMPGEALPTGSQVPDTEEDETVMLGGSSGESDDSERIRDAPLGPLAVLLGYPFWIF
jgi:hypothetical protein